MLNERIEQAFLAVLAELDRELVAPLTSNTVLLESGLDSLGFAILVARLEEELDIDPFTLNTEAYYPQTFGEFVAFYEKFYDPTSNASGTSG